MAKLSDGKTAEHSPAIVEFASHAYDSFKYNLVQAPVTGVMQLVDHFEGTKYAQETNVIAAPDKDDKFLSAEWFGDVVGGTGAAMVQFGLLHRLVGTGAAAKLETSERYGLKAALPYVAKSAATGVVIGSVFTPSDDTTDNFLWDRAKHGIVDGLSFATLTGGAIGLRSTGKAILANDAVANGLSSVLAGEVAADANARAFKGHWLATNPDRIQTIASYVVGGAAAGGLNLAHETLAPTTGIKGVRTIADAERMADSTMVAGHPEQYEFDNKQNFPPKPELLLDGRDLSQSPWYDQVAAFMRDKINLSSLPLEERKRIVAGFQQLGYGEETIHQIRDSITGDIISVYGSAREDRFRNALARWFGGMNGQKGNATITGGTIGVMRATNRGAYEANGISVGIPAKFKFEVGGKPNGYQTHVIPTRDFYVRMELLKKANAFVVFPGGIGTLAEGTDTITHVQTEKMPQYLMQEFGKGGRDGAPIYFIGKKYWAPTMKVLRGFVKAGTMSPEDFSLFKVLDDPRDVFKDLAKRKAAAHQALAEATAEKKPATSA
jgi:hypothetical protein